MIGKANPILGYLTLYSFLIRMVRTRLCQVSGPASREYCGWSRESTR